MLHFSSGGVQEERTREEEQNTPKEGKRKNKLSYILRISPYGATPVANVRRFCIQIENSLSLFQQMANSCQKRAHQRESQVEEEEKCIGGCCRWRVQFVR
jgi:hypothetical protein